MKNVGAIMIDKLPTTDIRILEVMAIQQVFGDNPGITRKQAAKLLGLSERTLYRKILDRGLSVGISSTEPVKYKLWNATDDIPCDFDREYDTVKEAEKGIEKLRKGFEHQGYYRTNKGDRIAIEDINYQIQIV